MKKSELRQIIREIIEEQAVDQFGGISGFSNMPDPQTMANIVPSGMTFNPDTGAVTGMRTQSYQDFIDANPGIEGQFGDAGTFNSQAWYNNFYPKVVQATNPCNFMKNQRQKLMLKYPAAGGKYKAQLGLKITIITALANNPESANGFGCNLPGVTPNYFAGGNE